MENQQALPVLHNLVRCF